MLDSEIAKKLITEGGIVSNGEFVYLPLRLTGTGIMERLKQDGTPYQIDRRMEDFASEEWMAQYANTPILLEHPKDEAGNPVRADLENGCFVGNTIDSFIKDDEIWVIGKLYDADTFELILERSEQDLPISTSPHFNSENLNQEGSEVLIERPLKINHLAIVERGFWDKKSQAPAIDVGDGNVTLLKGETMDEKEVEAADAVLDRSVIGTPKEDEASLEEKVAEIENVETKEGEALEKLAQDHKELDKGDSVEEEKKIDEEVKEVKADEAKEEAKEEAPKADSAEDKQDDSEVSGDYCDEDRQRESVLKTMHSLSDYARVPYVSGRVKAWKAQKEFAKSNLDLVDEKFRGLVDKIDSDTALLASEMFAGMVAKIEAKRAKDQAQAGNVGSGLFFGKFKDR